MNIDMSNLGFTGLQGTRLSFRLIGFLALGWLFLGLPIQMQAGGDLPVWVNTYFHLGKEDGLEGKIVYAIHHDRNGYLWLCTDMGVSRYDGYKFRNYSSFDGITDNDVFGMHEDSRGRLWLMTRSGVPCYFYRERFYNPISDPRLGKMVANNYASAFFEDTNHTIYLGFFDGAIYSMDTLNQIHVHPCDGLCRILGFGYNEAFGVFAVDNINQIHSLTKPGRLTKRVSEITINGSENYPVKFLQLSNGVCLYSWGRNIRVMDGAFRTHLHTDVIPTGKIQGIFEGNNGAILVATTTGAYSFADTSFSQPIEAAALQDHSIFSMLDESSSGRWYGTEDGAYLQPNVASQRLDWGGGEEEPSAICKLSNGHILVGFDNGTLIEMDENLVLLKRESIGQIAIKSLHPLMDTEVWIRTENGLFRRTQAGVEKIQNFNSRGLDFMPGDPKRVTFCNTIGWITVDATHFSEYLFGDSSLIYPKQGNDHQCFCIKYDSMDRVWVSDANGVGFVKNDKIRYLATGKELIQYSFISQILPARNGDLWFSTLGNGLAVYSNGHIFKFNQSNGLNSNFVTSIHEDPSGGIWVGTTRGLHIIRQTIEGSAPQFNILNASLWFKNSIIRTIFVTDSTLIVGSGKTLLRFGRDDIEKASDDLRTNIEIIRWNDGISLVDSTIKLSYSQNHLLFEFLAISFLASENIHYRYRLLGLSEEWSETGSTFARYSALPPGKFTFQVQAKFSGQAWSEQTSTFQFEIVPPFWKTSWFYLLLVFLIILVSGLTLFLILRSLKRRNEIVNRMIIAEQKALITQMNPHFIFNSLNSIQKFFLNNDLEKANDYLADFGNLIRIILENGRTSRISLGREILLLTLYIRLEALRLKNKFEYVISSDDLDEINTYLPPMILQPFVENSIWHGIAPKVGTGLISIHFSKLGSCLKIVIEDDGIGRKMASELKSKSESSHKSLAMSITLERLEILRKANPHQVSFSLVDLEDKFSVGIGTRVVITLPLDIENNNNSIYYEGNHS